MPNQMPNKCQTKCQTNAKPNANQMPNQMPNKCQTNAKPNAKPNAKQNAKQNAKPNAKPIASKPSNNSPRTWSWQRRQCNRCRAYHIVCGHSFFAKALTPLIESLMLCDAVCTAHEHTASRALPRHWPANLQLIQKFGISRNFFFKHPRVFF